jgi:hypothetical protein
VGTVAAVSVPQLRPLSVGEIIDVAVKIWRSHFGTLARIVLVVVTPIEILSVLVLNSVTPESAEPADGGEALGFLLGALTSLSLRLLAYLVSSAATLRAVSVAYLGGRPDWQDSLRAAASRFGSLLWLFVVSGAGLTLAFVLLVVPFFWLAVSWSLAFVVLIAEGLRGTAALSRSYRLVQGRWWPTLGALLLAFLIQIVVSAVIGIPLGVVTFNAEPGSAAALVSTAVANVISSVITTSFFSAVLVLIYYDLRVRKEGFDLAVMAQSIGMTGAGPPGGWPSGSPGGTQPGQPLGPPTVPPSSPPTGTSPGPPVGPPTGPPVGPPSGPPAGPPSRPPPDQSWPPPGSS